ncbi:MAG: hypothetical protein GTN64_07455 [Candidatus Latescibacteria bacterium]|nr:hypothetical protein [Candidatus Latescibacterota bacterium]NIO78439.1 hypothetical protein [Candidatus Latescibacterota bacterium]
MSKKTREIEMYVGRGLGGGDSGDWWTTYVEIPADTPEDKIESVAKKCLLKILNKNKEDSNRGSHLPRFFYSFTEGA